MKRRCVFVMASLCWLAGSVLSEATLAADEPVTRIEDVIYGRKSDLALTMDVFVSPKQNGAAIVHLANGGWHKAHENPANFAELLKRGYTVFRVVLAGEPKFTIIEQMPDVARAVRFIRFHAKTYHIDSQRLGIEGASSGGHMSLLHGMSGDEGDLQARDPIDRMSSRVQAAAVFFPLTDLLNYGAPDAVQGGDLGLLKHHRASFDFTEFDAHVNRQAFVLGKVSIVPFMFNAK